MEMYYAVVAVLYPADGTRSLAFFPGYVDRRTRLTIDGDPPITRSYLPRDEKKYFEISQSQFSGYRSKFKPDNALNVRPISTEKPEVPLN